MWAGLNWLIKNSVPLIACIVAKETKGGVKKARQMPVRGIHAHQPQTGRLSLSQRGLDKTSRLSPGSSDPNSMLAQRKAPNMSELEPAGLFCLQISI